ncbi:Cation transporter [Planctomycetales bacterium 10988]|nr:Cation transporter [Planctomycetales bacterium 10988]
MSLPEARKNPDTLYRDAIRAGLLGLVVNLALGFVKLAGGVWGNSFALISDAVNSLGDSVTSLVVIFGLHVAQRPADEEHPYGHSRAEAIAGSNVALLVILSAVYIGWEAIHRLFDSHAIPPLWTLWIAGANVLIKESLYRYKVRVGKRTGSSSIIANAWDHRADAFCSLAVLIGLGMIRWGGPSFLWADEVAAFVVAIAIVCSGIHLLRQSCSELMDLQADRELVQEIRSEAETVPEVKDVEKLWVRKSGLEYFVDIHIEVDQALTVAEGHRIGHQVKDHLVAKFPSLRDVLVHLEPFPHLHDQ